MLEPDRVGRNGFGASCGVDLRAYGRATGSTSGIIRYSMIARARTRHTVSDGATAGYPTLAVSRGFWMGRWAWDLGKFLIGAMGVSTNCVLWN